jgi:hypothetical protein
VNPPEYGNILGSNQNNPGQQNAHGSRVGNPAVFAPTAVFMIGDTKVTASAFADSSSLLFGSQVLRAGGSAIVTAGQTLSFGSGGRLQIGALDFGLPVPTKALQSTGQASQSWIVPNTPMAAGVSGRTSDRPGSASIYQIDDDVPGLSGSDKGGPSRWTEASGFANPTGTVPTATARKYSGAGRIKNVMPLCGLAIGVISMSLALL